MSEIAFNRVGEVAVVTMANPPANTYTAELGDGLLAAVHKAADEGVRAMVLQADGALFCGGADVSMFKDRSAADARALFAEGFELVAALEDAPFPVIAAVHGACLAAGLELALACDLIVAAEGTEFSQTEAKIGAATFLGGVHRLAQRCGPARAKEIAFNADTYDAETFERWNIINRVVPADELRDTALAWAQRLAAGPTAAHAVTKQLVQHTLSHGAREADSHLLDVATPLVETRDLQHAVNLLLTQGVRKFMASHHEVTFEGR